MDKVWCGRDAELTKQLGAKGCCDGHTPADNHTNGDTSLPEKYYKGRIGNVVEAECRHNAGNGVK